VEVLGLSGAPSTVPTALWSIIGSAHPSARRRSQTLLGHLWLHLSYSRLSAAAASFLQVAMATALVYSVQLMPSASPRSLRRRLLPVPPQGPRLNLSTRPTFGTSTDQLVPVSRFPSCPLVPQRLTPRTHASDAEVSKALASDREPARLKSSPVSVKPRSPIKSSGLGLRPGLT